MLEQIGIMYTLKTLICVHHIEDKDTILMNYLKEQYFVKITMYQKSYKFLTDEEYLNSSFKKRFMIRCFHNEVYNIYSKR